jgi:ribosomal protein RSM22 (predicted rRNA methylase)
VAPCPHAGECPMAGADWCHFAARAPRSALHRRVKGGELGHEDEKFSFVAAAREPAPPVAGRVLRHPRVRGGHVLLQACTPEGLARLTVARSDGARFRAARDLRWGDPLPPP